MTRQYLGQLKLPLEDEGLYLDCGILFPFYYKDAYTINTTRWANDICELATHHKVKTTSFVWHELKEAYRRIPMPLETKQSLKKLYSSIREKIETIHVGNVECRGKLSKADMSLLLRPDQNMKLLTADRALFLHDNNGILIIWDQKSQKLSYQTEKILIH